MMGMFQMFEEEARLEELKKELKPADLRKENKCVKCGFCCHRRTCIPTPEELKKIAEFLKLTPKELINKFFAIDTRFGGDYYIKPLGENIKDLAGKFIPSERTYNEGKCIFLDINNECKIYPVRPITARTQECWNDNNSSNEREKTLSLWKDKILEKEFGIEIKEDD